MSFLNALLVSITDCKEIKVYSYILALHLVYRILIILLLEIQKL